jgi:hypothetical protein
LTAEEGLFDLSCGKKGADLLSCSSPSYRLWTKKWHTKIRKRFWGHVFV